MLARSAEGLYWMGRYIARAEQLCRLLQIQVQALVDRPVPEIHFGWRRLYSSLADSLLLGELDEEESDDFALADAYTLADNLTFERGNPHSVISCVACARENARQTRTCISGEMWTTLNLAYLRLRDTSMQDVWTSQAEGFYGEIIRDIQAFTGTIGATMYRDCGWSFFSYGRYLENAQQLVTFLLAHNANEPEEATLKGAGRASLLRAFRAQDAYQSRHGIEIRTELILDLLVTDPRLPRSLSRSLQQVEEALEGAGHAPDPQRASAVAAQVAGTRRLLSDGWNRAGNAQAVLKHAASEINLLHDRLAEAYFRLDADGE